jgi:transcription antitermination factor NusG
MSWHTWTINQQRYKHIIDYLSNMPEVKDFLYPTASKEYDTKSGKKTKDVPLYSNYIFINYEHTNRLHTQLSEYPWIKDYLGQCSNSEIEQVKKLSNKAYEDIMPLEEIEKGKLYKLKGTPFKGMSCVVVDVEGDKLAVSIELFGSDRIIKCSVDDIYLEG